MLKRRTLIFAMLVTGTVLSCWAGLWLMDLPRGWVKPFGSLPEQEIVFQVDHTTLGFVQPDGSDVITRTMQQVWPVPPFARSLTVSGVRWSADGQSLVGRFYAGHNSAQTGLPFVIGPDGAYTDCLRHGDFWLFGGAPLQPLADGTVLTVIDYERVVSADLDNCEITRTWYTAVSANEFIQSAALSVQGWLAIHRTTLQPERIYADEVYLLAPDGQPSILAEASYPAWSPDGEWLVYSKHEGGLYLTDKQGQQTRTLVADVFGYRDPVWSPDGRWLVYTGASQKQPALFIVEVATGRQQLIYVGGYSPQWRPAAAP